MNTAIQVEDYPSEKHTTHIEHCERCWRDAYQAAVHFEEECRTIEERYASKADKFSGIGPVEASHAALTKLEEFRKTIIADLIRYAELEFAPIGGYLNIRRAEDVGAIKGISGDLAHFSPRTVWEYLDQTFGNGAGAERAYEDATRWLLAHFKPILAESYDVSDHKIENRLAFGAKTAVATGMSVYGYRSKFNSLPPGFGEPNNRGTLLQIATYLATVSTAVGFDVGSDANLREPFRNCDRLKYGARFELSQHCTVICRKTETEFHFSPKAAQAIITFVNQYKGSSNG